MTERKESLSKELASDKNFQKAFKLLDNKEQLLDNIMNAMGDGLSIQDKDMKIVYQNRFMTENFGSHIGEYCYKVYEGRDEICEGCPIIDAYKNEDVTRALRVGVTKEGEKFRFENIASVLKSDQGEVVAGMELVRVVEDRERAYDELKIATKNLLLAKTVFENSSEGIMVIDKDKKIISANPAFEKITGYKEKEVIGKSPEFLDSGHTKKNFYAYLWESLKDTSSWHGEVWNKHKNGHNHALTMSIDTIFSQKNEISQYVCIFYDITEQKLMENELRNKEKMMISQSRQSAMGEMIGIIAHQWRQPLAAICMEVNTLLIDLEFENIEKKELAKTMSSVNKRLQSLSKIIDGFRNHFQKEKEKEVTTASQVIKAALQLIEKSLEYNNIVINTNLKSQSSFTTFPNELIQVFINIFSNAKDILINNQIKNPIIHIETEENEKEIIFHICDNAGGVPEQLLEKIFEPYYTTSEKKVGAGLGLYISKIIIETHLNGALKVRNKNDGACFDIMLPKK